MLSNGTLQKNYTAGLLLYRLRVATHHLIPLLPTMASPGGLTITLFVEVGCATVSCNHDRTYCVYFVHSIIISLPVNVATLGISEV